MGSDTLPNIIHMDPIYLEQNIDGYRKIADLPLELMGPLVYLLYF